jgi:leader peptidase (prepilin peptidase) / N-methyltransferase
VRWPEEDEEHPPGRRVDWRTVICVAVGAAGLGLLAGRFPGDLLASVVMAAWIVTLVVGLATDLDRRILPDELTLPVIPIALLYSATGANPLVGTEIVPAILAAVLIPAVLYLPSIPFGEGAFGLGDVKLLAGTGLLLGGERALGGTLFGLVLAGVVLLILLAARRIGRRSYVPFGPFLIIGALWALLIRVP